MGCHFLLREVFPTQGSNPRLLHLLPWRPGSLLPVPPGSRDADCDVLCTLKLSHPFEKDQSASWDERGLTSKWKNKRRKSNPHPTTTTTKAKGTGSSSLPLKLRK